MGKKILVTGMSGQIGRIIRKYMANKYSLSGIDKSPAEDCDVLLANLDDLEAMQPAFENIDTVVHLGADPSPRASWDSILKNNIVGTRNVYEAARIAGVKRVVFASSNHTVGYYPLREEPYKAIFEGRLNEIHKPPIPLNDKDLRPDSYYGVSKSFGESLGSYFYDAFGLSVICMRIGWVMTPDDPTFHPAALSLWLSHRDTAQLIEKCIEAPETLGFAIVHGMSNNKLRIWESEITKRLIDFDPQDDAGETWTEKPNTPSFI